MQSKSGKKKILYVITKSNFGGAQKYVYELATSLDSELYEVSVALGGNGTLTQKLEDAGIPIITIPHLERNISITKELRVFGFLRDLFRRERYDAIHLNSSKIGGIGGIAARLAGCKNIIFTAHGWAFNENRSSLSKLVIKISYFVTLLLSTKTIAVSHNIKAQIKSWPLVQNKITVIHNGVSQTEYLPIETAHIRLSELVSDSPIATPNQEQGGKIILGTLAELHHIKGLDILLRAIANLKDKHGTIHLYIFGEGEERANTEQLIQELDIENHVTLLRYVDNATTFLKLLDIFVLPSRSEALSLAVLEAGFAELPVVATNVGGIPEIITSGEHGILVEKENVSALEIALEKMITDTDFRMRCASALHKKVVVEFSLEQMVSQTTRLY